METELKNIIVAALKMLRDNGNIEQKDVQNITNMLYRKIAEKKAKEDTVEVEYVDTYNKEYDTEYVGVNVE